MRPYKRRETGPLRWASYSFAAYDAALSAALLEGTRIYSPAYIIPPPSFGERRKHANHLRLLEHMMACGLPGKIAAAGSLAGAYQVLREYPSLGPFLAYQFALDLGYSPVLDADEMTFVVPGPGALDGPAKCFEDSGGLAPADLIRWIADTAAGHFAERGNCVFFGLIRPRISRSRSVGSSRGPCFRWRLSSWLMNAGSMTHSPAWTRRRASSSTATAWTRSLSR